MNPYTSMEIPQSNIPLIAFWNRTYHFHPDFGSNIFGQLSIFKAFVQFVQIFVHPIGNNTHILRYEGSFSFIDLTNISV